MPETRGTVTLPLHDYLKLRLDAGAGEELKQQVRDSSLPIQKASKELANFLDRCLVLDGITEVIQEFNATSKNSRIHVNEGKALIELL